ncbi:hypothetical protein RFI_39760, partial [Reticulomyxa filosa]
NICVRFVMCETNVIHRTNSTLFQTFQKTFDVNCFLSLLLFKKYWKKECKRNAYLFVATAILTLITLEWIHPLLLLLICSYFSLKLSQTLKINNYFMK